MPLPLDEIIARARHIRILLLDCDGVLTDGSIIYTSDGERVYESTKVFHIHDGQGLRLAKEAGLKLGVVSGRSSRALTARAEEMRIDHLHQGVANKLEVYEQLKTAESVSDEEIAYIGDDLPDLAPMRQCGLAIAVADAVDEVRECAHIVTGRNGGRGAVREAIEFILKAQDKWEEVIQPFTQN